MSEYILLIIFAYILGFTITASVLVNYISDDDSVAILSLLWFGWAPIVLLFVCIRFVVKKIRTIMGVER